MWVGVLCWVQEATRERRAANAALVAERRAAGARSSSIYNGVWWDKNEQQWKATLRMGGVKRALGYFDDEAEAAKAIDRALVAAGRDGEVNFRDGQATNFQYDRHGDPLKKSSPYHGATFNSTSKKWGARVYLPLCRNKPEAAWCAEGKCECTRSDNRLWLGKAHLTQEVAAKAHDRALRDYKLPKETHAPNFDYATGRSHWTLVYEGRTLTKATYSDPPPAGVPALG